ncbi:MAG: hypothetical protein U1F77_13235 [Kiritimatiellia bacterium]
MKQPRKSLVISTILLVFAWCAHHLIWGGDIDPPDTSDLLPTPEVVPDEENAYFPLDEAFQLLQMTWEEGNALDEHLKGKKPMSAEALDDLLAKNQAALDRLPAALERPRLRVPPEPPRSAKPSFISNSLNVLRLLRAKTRLAIESSSLDSGVTACVLRMHFAERLVLQGRDGIMLIVGIDFGHRETLKDMRRMCRHPLATPEQLRTMASAIDQMGDRSPCILSAMQYEYLFFTRRLDKISNGTIDIHKLSDWGDGKLIPLPKGTPLCAYIFKPNYTKLAMADYTRMIIQNVGLYYSSWGKGEDQYAAFGLERINFKMLWTKSNVVGAMIFVESAIFGAPFGYLNRECALKCDAAGTRIMLACRLFELEKGRMPDKLEELVPELLPTVPADPFDGKPMRYDARRKVVYAVGPDLIDSGGSTNKVEKSIQGWTREPWNREDIVYPMGLENSVTN